jgi:signal transduction histidine kinase
MKLTQTFGLGAALAVLPLAAGLAYAVNSLQTLSEQNERLMLRQLAAVRLGTGVVARLDRLGEYRRKYAVIQDRGYAQKAEETAAAIDTELLTLQSSDLVVDSAPFDAFSQRWREYRVRAMEDDGAVLALDELSSGARDLLSRAHEAALSDALEARRAREATTSAAVLATVLALVSSATVIVLLVRRLRLRLDDFVLATDAVSRGTFTTQLPTTDEEDELSRVALAFNRMVSALDQLERMKADFLSSISHELKTPLVAMVETNEALLDDIAGPLQGPQRRMIELNRQAAQRLSGMISELLELSVVRSSMRYQMGTHDVSVLVTDGASALEALARDRGQTLQVDVEPGVVCDCDPDRVVQVVQNLVENAIKYTPKSGHIEVRLQAAVSSLVPGAAHNASYALLTVDDTGPGIPEDDRTRVFEKFFRRQGVSSPGGVGLGLAICKEIVTAHRGFIWVREGRLAGAGVSVALPRMDKVERA